MIFQVPNLHQSYHDLTLQNILIHNRMLLMGKDSLLLLKHQLLWFYYLLLDKKRPVWDQLHLMEQRQDTM